tara:strand:+ start:4513 stop:5928 length:1416 start_codon:yes stop_codon:yes gene_type:complete
MAQFKSFAPADFTQPASSLNQLIDVIQEDISGSATRRKYQVFVTGGIGPGVTSSLYQTVYDQDYSLQTANPIFDMSVGLFHNSAVTNIVSEAPGYSVDTSGKLLFASQSLMMREKVDVYRQFSSYLLGNADHAFYLGGNSYPRNNGTVTTDANRINSALFLNVKRLFARDKVRKETFAMRFYTSASLVGQDQEKYIDGTNELGTHNVDRTTGVTGSANIGNAGIAYTSESGVEIFADVGSNADSRNTVAGTVARLKMASDTTRDVGLLFYDTGVVVLDIDKVSWTKQPVYGLIDAMNNTSFTHQSDKAATGITAGGTNVAYNMISLGTIAKGTAVIGDSSCNGNISASFSPDFLVSASIDNILDHFSSTRFSSGTLTAAAFQNQTQIQSTIYFCRAAPGEFNYSSNPTFVDTSNNLNVIEDSTDPTERSFTFITSVGLYGPNMDLLAVGKVSRPIEKNDEKDLTVRVRLDF